MDNTETYYKKSHIKKLFKEARESAKEEQRNNLLGKDGIYDETVDSYYQGIIDHIDDIAKELQIRCLWC